MEPILQIENLIHTYSAGTPFQRSAVENMNLHVGTGEFLGIIGHTGSGKSTLIQHLNGLLKPTSGRILLEGKDIWADPKSIRSVRFRVGLVFQYPEYQSSRRRSTRTSPSARRIWACPPGTSTAASVTLPPLWD